MWPIATILENIGHRTGMQHKVALILNSFLFSLSPYRTLGRGKLFLWSRKLIMPCPWTKLPSEQ